MKVIPIKAQAGICGFDVLYAKYTELNKSLHEILIRYPAATFVGLASGDSMQGVGIFDGDILIVDRSAELRQNDVIVASFNGEFVCKIVDVEKRLLISANPDFDSVKVRTTDDFSLEGIVISSVRLHRNALELYRKIR